MADIINIKRVLQFPTPYEASTLYIVKSSVPGYVSLYLTNKNASEYFSCMRVSDINSAIMEILNTWVPELTRSSNELANAIQLTLSGDVNGSASVDWKNDVVIETTIQSSDSGSKDTLRIHTVYEEEEFINPRPFLVLEFENPPNPNQPHVIQIGQGEALYIKGSAAVSGISPVTDDLCFQQYFIEIGAKCDFKGIVTLGLSKLEKFPATSGGLNLNTELTVKKSDGTPTDLGSIWLEFRDETPLSLVELPVVINATLRINRAFVTINV